MKPSLLILAAGIGSRYGGLKQIDPVGPRGEIVLDYSLYDALQSGFGKCLFVIRRDIEQAFRESVGRRLEKQLPVEYVFQELADLPPGRVKPWGTGHAILSGAGAVREPFGVVNADDFYGAASFRALIGGLRNSADSTPARYGMVGFVLRNTLSEFGAVSRGVCRCDERGFLQGISEHKQVRREGDAVAAIGPDGAPRKLTGGEIVSMNLWGFTPSVFGHLKELFSGFLKKSGGDPKAEFGIPGAIDSLIAGGKAQVKVATSACEWFGVTYKEDRESVMRKVRGLIAQGAYPDPLWG